MNNLARYGLKKLIGIFIWAFAPMVSVIITMFKVIPSILKHPATFARTTMVGLPFGIVVFILLAVMYLASLFYCITVLNKYDI